MEDEKPYNYIPDILNAVEDMIIRGAKDRMIVDYVRNKFEIGNKIIKKYIAEAENRIEATMAETRGKRMAIANARIDDLYARNFAMGEWGECRKLILDKATLNQDFAPIDTGNKARKITVRVGGTEITSD